MRRPDELSVVQPRPPEKRMSPSAWRNLIATLLAVVTAACLGSTSFFSKGTQFLMPGPLASAHGAIEKCSSCHTKSGSGKLTWTHGLVAGDPFADSQACLTCHQMPQTAFNAHSASKEVLRESTKRLTKVARKISAPQSARLQNAAFPAAAVLERELYCATCHQEHQGVGFNLSKISNEQCRSCHVVQFDSFDGNHPQFENFPFQRRSRIIFDHAGHFDKHYPEVTKKDATRRIPETCASCHTSTEDRRIMAVVPFDQTCTSCHLDQILGEERASGPKGIAFLSLPGLDLETLKAKKARVGEWPGASEAPLTPFMKVMLSGNERGRGLLKTVDKLNLQDLAKASDGEIKAVTELAWEIKGLYHALITNNAADVLGKLDIGGGTKLSASQVTDLTASIPRDVILGAQQQWLPNLAAEMANPGQPAPPRQDDSEAAAVEAEQANVEPAGEETGSEVPDTSADSEDSTDDAGSSDEPSQADEPETELGLNGEADGSAPDNTLDPPPCSLSILGQCLVVEEQKNSAEATVADLPAAAPNNADTARATEPIALAANTGAQPSAGGGGKKDELLFPTEDELREINEHHKGAGQTARPKGVAGESESSSAGEDAGAVPQAGVEDASGIESDVDPESWADYGGWYRQDYAIYYRPVGHKDKFIYSWLVLTGPRAAKASASPAAAVFDYLTNKDAQGSCTKCHSVDEIGDKARLVNFAPLEAKTKQGRFTNFVHEPHLSIQDNRGCLTCHALAQGQPGQSSAESAAARDAESTEAAAASPKAETAGGGYLKSYEHGRPQDFTSGFSGVKKDLCQTCHTAGRARQDCLLCHEYHVNDVITPIMNTKLSTQ